MGCTVRKVFVHSIDVLLLARHCSGRVWPIASFHFVARIGRADFAVIATAMRLAPSRQDIRATLAACGAAIGRVGD